MQRMQAVCGMQSIWKLRAKTETKRFKWNEMIPIEWKTGQHRVYHKNNCNRWILFYCSQYLCEFMTANFNSLFYNMWIVDVDVDGSVDRCFCLRIWISSCCFSFIFIEFSLIWTQSFGLDGCVTNASMSGIHNIHNHTTCKCKFIIEHFS